MRDESLATDVDLAALSKRTELFSGSDLKRTFLYCISLLNGLELNDYFRFVRFGGLGCC